MDDEDIITDKLNIIKEDIIDDEDLRIFACDVIQTVGISLKLPQTAMTTAQMLLQRVYHKKDYTFKEHPLDITAMAALFLGAKIEEYPKKARDVIETFVNVLSDKLNRDLRLHRGDYEKIREKLITAERRLLKSLGFNLLSSYPHKIIVNYFHAIVHALDPQFNVYKERDNNRLLQKAWNYCNDSLRTEVFIKYNEVAVACACIQMACEDTQILFPKSTDGREWFLLFTEDKSEVEAAMSMIRDLYRRETPSEKKLRKYIYITAKLRL